jgi:hypothetical protein
MNDDVMKPPQVYAAIAAVMAKLAKVGISKDRTAQTGGSGSYKFRGIDDVYNTLAPYLSECQLLILPRVLSREVTERLSNNNKALFYVVLDVEFDFVSAADGSKHTVRVCGEAMDSGDKATNKAMSAAYKYACMEAFCIPTEGDNDADATTHEVKPGGVTIVDPRGDDHTPSDPQVVDAWLAKIKTAMSAPDPAAAIYAIHLDLAPDDTLYINVADAAAAQGICNKGKWKEFVRHGNPKNRTKAA